MDKHDASLGIEGDGDGVDLDVGGNQCLVLDVEAGVRQQDNPTMSWISAGCLDFKLARSSSAARACQAFL